MARVFLGAVELRNEHRIYRNGNLYEDEQVDGRGQRHTTTITKETAKHLLERLSGRYVTVEDAAEVLEPAARQLGLPYTYGYKLNFYAQSALLVLVVLGYAELEKEGRRYYYQVSGASWKG